MREFAAKAIDALARQAPGILGVIATVAMSFAFMRQIAVDNHDAFQAQIGMTRSVLERNTEAFLEVHKHFEQIARLLERR